MFYGSKEFIEANKVNKIHVVLDVLTRKKIKDLG
jgi:hypothetical protein